VKRSNWLTQDGGIASAAIASASRGCRARMRICATAALASLAFSRVIAASHAEEVPYPSALCASAASNRRENPACAAVSFARSSPREAATPPGAGTSNWNSPI
jgi:hypothetical protein